MFGWAVLSAVCFAIAVAIHPSLIVARLPDKASSITHEIVLGVQLVRLVLGACAAMAIVTGLWLRHRTLPATVPRPERRWDHSDSLAVAVLATIGLAVRVPNLNKTLFWDELSTLIRVVQRGPLVIMTFATGGNNHPVNSLLMWPLLPFGGHREWVLRLPQLLFGLGSALAAYVLLREEISRRVAFFAAFVLALHFRVVVYSDMARGYASGIFFIIVATLLFVRLWKAYERRTALAFLAAGIGVCGSMATLLVVPAAHGAIGLLHPDSRFKRLDLFLLGVWTCLLSLLAFGFMLPQVAAYSARPESLTSHATLGAPLLLSTVEFITGSGVLGLALLFFAMSIVGFVTGRLPYYFWLAAWGPGLAFVLAIALTHTATSPRLFLMFIFPFALGLALFLDRCWSSRGILGRAAAIVIAATWIASAVPSYKAFYSNGFVPVKELAKVLQQREVILLGPQAPLFLFYFPDAIVAKSWAEVDADLVARRQYLVVDYPCENGIPPEVEERGYAIKGNWPDWSINDMPLLPLKHPCLVLGERR